jgi:hypothetical protein
MPFPYQIFFKVCAAWALALSTPGYSLKSLTISAAGKSTSTKRSTIRTSAVRKASSIETTFGVEEDAALKLDCDVVIMGPFDSGTNLLKEMLVRNWVGEKWQQCLWKHSVSPDPEEVHNFMQKWCSPNISVLMMTRSPLAQLASWKKAPYKFKNCLNNLSDPCYAPIGPSRRGPGIEENYQNMTTMMSTYNSYIRQYKVLLNKGLKSLMIAYEDLVMSPEATMNRVAATLGWPERSEIFTPDEPAKSHGQSHGRAEAMMALRARPWLETLSREEQQQFCSGLDAKLLSDVSEGDQLGHNYMHDCNGQQHSERLYLGTKQHHDVDPIWDGNVLKS